MERELTKYGKVDKTILATFLVVIIYMAVGIWIQPQISHYEDCLTDLASIRKIYYNLVDDLAWLEIDDENHYKRAAEIIYPLILERDSA